jgi:hypothetical protein
VCVKGPAADATDASQPWGFLCYFFVFPSNGAPVEWNWQGKTEVLGEKNCPIAALSTTNPTWTDPGSNTGLRGERPANNRLSHGTALPLVFAVWTTAEVSDKIMYHEFLIHFYQNIMHIALHVPSIRKHDLNFNFFCNCRSFRKLLFR